MFGWGPLEMVLVIFVVLLFFGAKRIPEVAASMGKGIREFKDSVSGHDDKDEAPPQPAASLEPPAATPYTAPTTEQGPVHHTKD